jgi:16S rRNA G1207 methylase RsmC
MPVFAHTSKEQDFCCGWGILGFACGYNPLL